MHHWRVAREVLIYVFIHFDFTRFFNLSGTHVALGKYRLNAHKPISL